MSEYAISIISFTVGVMSLMISFVFYFLARKSEKLNKGILDNINNAIEEWQSKIMASAIELIESRPDIVVKRQHLENTKAKHELLYNLLERVKYIIEQPFLEENSIPQTARLNTLLTTVTNIIKSDIPPEVWGKLADAQSKTQPDKITNDPNKPKN